MAAMVGRTVPGKELSNGPTTAAVQNGVVNGNAGGSGEAPALVGKLEDVTVNKGQKIEYMLNVTGAKPLNVTWTRNGTTKLKSNKNMKVTYSSSQGDTKMMVMEADAEDDGEYKVEASNQFGTAVLTCIATVILPEKVGGLVKQKDKTTSEEEVPELKKFQKRGSVVEMLNKTERKGSTRGSVTALPDRTLLLKVISEKTAPNPPSKPSRPEVVDVDRNRVELNWKLSNDAANVVESFDIQMRIIGGEWEQAKSVSGEETSAVIQNLEEGVEYEFRLVPNNDGGAGEPSDPTPPVKTGPKQAKPRIDRTSFVPTQKIKQGQEFNFVIKYAGEPRPDTTWARGDVVLTSSDKLMIDNVDHTARIVCKTGHRKDTGVYKFTASNNIGADSAEVELIVIGPPAAPKGPIKVLDVQKSSILIGWNPPEDDGGQPITGYVVEKMDVKTGMWDSVTYNVGADVTQFRVPDLVENNEYMFRVRAQNEEGLSEPLNSENATKATNAFDVTKAPGKPHLVSCSKTFIKIKWEKPKYDGPFTPLTPIGFNVKRKDAKMGPWSQVNTEALMEQEFTDSTVTANQEYVYHIMAVNDGVESVPSEQSDVIKAALLQDSPKLDMSALSGKEICVNSGEQLKVEVPVTGSPFPVVTWQKEKKALAQSDTIKQATGDEKAVLNITSAVRGDTGKYTITAKNEFGEDSGDFGVIVYSTPTPPKGPLNILDVQKDSVLIGWNPPEDDGGKPITGYIFETMDMKPGKWEALTQSVGPDVNEFRVPKLKEGNDYKFRVRARNERGVSDPLDSEKAVRVKNPYDPADAPGKPEVVDSDRTFIKIKWTKPKKDGGAAVTGYNVERKDPRTGNWGPVSDAAVAGEEFTDSTVSAGKYYEYQVTALNEGGESKPSEPSGLIRAWPLKEAPKIDLSKLAGKEIRVRAGEQIKLDVPVTSTPAPTLTWFKEKKTLSFSDRVRQEAGSEEKVTLFVTSAVRGDTGNYSITARNEFGEDSGEFTIVVLDKPPAPSDLIVQDVFADRCTLTWKPPTDDGGAEISGYVIERKDEDDDYWETLPDVVSSSPSHVVKGLVKGQKYKFRVRAENIYGLSDPVQTDKAILAKNPYDRPDAPGKPEVVDSDKDQIIITWTPPRKDGGSPILGYNVERKDPKSGRWSKMNSDLIKGREYTDFKVIAGKEYEYQVTAENAGGESDPSEISAPIKAKPLKAAPQLDQSALDIAENRIRAGNPLALEVPIIASPSPYVKWTKDGNTLEDTSRVQQMFVGEDLATLNIKACKRSDSGVYTVSASNKFGADSATITVLILDKPGMPENLQVSNIEAQNCKLTWEAPADNGGAEILGYVVERCEEENSHWKKMNGIILGTSYVAKDLKPLHSYKFRIRAENLYGVGDSLQTNNAIMTKELCIVPQMESDLSEKSVNKGETLKVKIPFTGTGPLSFKLHKGNHDITDKIDRIKLVPFEDYVLLQIKDAVQDDSSRYRVEVTNSAGTGNCVIPVKVKATPGKCSGLTVTDVTKSGCRLSWRPPTNDGGLRISNYVVEKQLVSKPHWTAVSSFVKEVNVDVKSLVENKEYLFRVAAVNTNGVGEWLETPTAILAKMPFDVPEPPGEPRAQEIGGDFVSLTWPKPLSNGGGRILGYYIDKKEANSEVWFRINMSLCPATIFSIPNLLEGKEYDFRVIAVNEAGESRPSATPRRILVKNERDNEPDEAPRFPFPLRDRYIQEGHGVKLFASLDGKPKPLCTWFKDGKPLANGIKYSVVFTKGVCSLEIVTCTAADAGRYTCIAKNPLGEAECTCKVDINAKNGYQ